MRHAREHWLRIQAEAAVNHALSGDEKVAIDSRAIMHTSGSMQPTEPWISCSMCDCVLYDGDKHKALESYRILANGDAICSECDGDEAADFHASGQGDA